MVGEGLADRIRGRFGIHGLVPVMLSLKPFFQNITKHGEMIELLICFSLSWQINKHFFNAFIKWGEMVRLALCILSLEISKKLTTSFDILIHKQNKAQPYAENKKILTVP